MQFTGLQCHSALFTWKVSFEVDGKLYEILLSACNAVEEDQWKAGLQNRFSKINVRQHGKRSTTISEDLNLKPTGVVFCQAATLARRLSIQRAATVGKQNNVCQVIIRNTHNVQDLHDMRHVPPAPINRSQSHLSTQRIVILAPRRSERSRLETSLADVWTRERLPYPGMIASRSGQIFRASAGSLVRKLSLASMHGTFGRRAASLTLAQQRSHEAMLIAAQEQRAETAVPHVYEIQRKDSLDRLLCKDNSQPQDSADDHTLNDISKLSEDFSGTTEDGTSLFRTLTKKRERRLSKAAAELDPESPAQAFYSGTSGEGVEHKFGTRKRWSNPIGMLKNISAEGFRHLLYSSR